MKKLSTFLCALTVAAGAAFSPVFAVDGDTSDHTALKTSAGEGMSQDVNAKSVSGTVYDVDIFWGAMQFRYNTTWDPASHTYSSTETSAPTGDDDSAFSVDAGISTRNGWYTTASTGENNDAVAGNEVLIRNHSNVAINDAVAYTTATGATANLVTTSLIQEEATGSLSGSVTFPSAEAGASSTLAAADTTGIITTPATAATSKTTLQLAGAPGNDAFKTGGVIGTLTITLTDPSVN